MIQEKYSTINHSGFPDFVFRLVEKLLGMVQKQFFLLKGVGLATQELTDEYDNVIETVEKGREVSWADQKTTDHCSSEKSLFISFQATSVGTPQSRTPIRKRQFNTPVANTNMMPCRSATRSNQVIRTFTHSQNSDIGNTCISLTKEFDAMSTPAKVSCSLQEKSEGQKPVTPGGTTRQSVKQNRNMATPLRVPSSTSFIVSDNISSPAVLNCQNTLNEQLNCVPRKVTPHPKVCWADSPVKVEHSPLEKIQSTLRNATPMRESTDFNLSGIQALAETPKDKDQQMINMSSQQVFVNIT